MSNPGLIVLAAAPSITPNLRRFVIEDNIGEAIHIHWNQIRLDFTIEEFLSFSYEVGKTLKKLSSYGIPNLTDLPATFLNSLGHKVLDIREIRAERRYLDELKIIYKNNSNGGIGTKSLAELNSEDLIKLSENFQSNTKCSSNIQNEHERTIVLYEGDEIIRFGVDVACSLKLNGKVELVDISVICFESERIKFNKENTPPKLPPLKSPIPKLMLLAGMPGTGKSTLLKKSLIEKKQLFGEQFDGVFHKLNLPKIFPEESLSLEEKLNMGTWINEFDLIKLHLNPKPTKDLVVHFDLFYFLFSALRWDSSLGYIKDTNQLKDFLLDSDRVLRVFSKVFRLSSVRDKKYQFVSLKPSYDDVQARWIERETKLNRWGKSEFMLFLRNHIYHDHGDGKEIYENIYSSWHQALEK